MWLKGILMKHIANQLFYLMLLLFIIGSIDQVFAEGMQVKAGLWETKSVVTLPFGGGTQENTSQDCFSNTSVTPEEMMKDAEGCTILDADVTAETMSWTISCQNAGVEMIGEGHAKAKGQEKISGGMNISATFDGQEMVMTTRWEGKYIGDCE